MRQERVYFLGVAVSLTKLRKLSHRAPIVHTYIYSLATARGCAHLAESGCLCTKQALLAVQAKLLEPGYEFTGKQAFPHSKWYGHQKAHLDHCCFMRKGFEFAPQKIPQNHSGIKWLGLVADGKLNEKLPDTGA